jgi:phosphoenolpyruvate carboxylase
MQAINIDNKIEEIRKECILHRFNNELDNTKDNGRKETIKKIINEMEGVTKYKHDNNKTEQTMKDMFAKLDKQVYMQTWNKLQDFHRLVKIKEFVDTNYADDKRYDTNEQKITKIVNLKENDKKEFMMVAEKTKKK